MPIKHMLLQPAVAKSSWIDMCTTHSQCELDPGLHPTCPLDILKASDTLVHCKIRATLCRSGEPAEFWYRVVAGGLRKCVFALDGSRRVVDFLRPGDLFGFDSRTLHEFDVEAIMPGTSVARYPRRSAEQLANTDLHVARWVRDRAVESMARAERRSVILGHATPSERVSQFLLEIADRYADPRINAFRLPMSRCDIADYLALAVESVSRALTNLRAKGVIRFTSLRCVQICDRPALERASQGLLSRTSAPVKGTRRHNSKAAFRAGTRPSSAVGPGVSGFSGAQYHEFTLPGIPVPRADD